MSRTTGEDRHSFTVQSATRRDGTIDVLLTLRSRGRTLEVPMPLGIAYELACQLQVLVQAVLAGQPRPWDADPGRVPFGSAPRPRRSGGARSEGRAARGRSGSPPAAGYPRPRAVRPEAGGESAA